MTKSATKHRIHIVLTSRQYNELAREAKIVGESVSRLIREMIQARIDARDAKQVAA